MELLPLPAEDQLAAAADPAALLLADKRSAATRRAYRGDWRDFFGTGREDPTPEQVRAFVALPPPAVALRLAQYKADLRARDASEATINRRLAAVRSLLKFCFRLGFAQTDGRGLVDGEKNVAYRDTRGVGLKLLKKLIAAPGTATPRALRDTALLRLLCENALRRAEVCALNVGDLRPAEKRLDILGKGHGSQKMPVSLSPRAADALTAYLAASGHGADPGKPLFLGLHHSPRIAGQRLTPDGLYYVVGHYGKQVGIPRLTPHRLRHSAITAALDSTGGNVRAAQRLSRHADLRTLTRYDDNRSDIQGDVTRALSDLLG